MAVPTFWNYWRRAAAWSICVLVVAGGAYAAGLFDFAIGRDPGSPADSPSDDAKPTADPKAVSIGPIARQAKQSPASPAKAAPRNDSAAVAEGQWEYSDFPAGAVVSYEIYDTFPPLMIRCLKARRRIELEFFAEDPRQFTRLVLERPGRRLRFATRFVRDGSGQDFGYAVASFPVGHPVAVSLGADVAPLVFRQPGGGRLELPYDGSIRRVATEC